MNSIIEEHAHEANRPLHLEQQPQNPNSSFYLEPQFCKAAEKLRAQFEKQISESIAVNDGLTPLLLAFYPQTYHFLSASAERIFSPDVLDKLTEGLSDWASERLKVGFVSTPQMRVYTKDCWRDLLQDNTPAEWHYMLCLSRNLQKKSARVKIVTETSSRDTREGALRLDRVTTLQLQFNDLLIHRTRHAYAIETHKLTADPLQGFVFLDGYLW